MPAVIVAETSLLDNFMEKNERLIQFVSTKCGVSCPHVVDKLLEQLKTLIFMMLSNTVQSKYIVYFLHYSYLNCRFIFVFVGYLERRFGLKICRPRGKRQRLHMIITTECKRIIHSNFSSFHFLITCRFSLVIMSTKT